VSFREKANNLLSDFFADVKYQGEIVRVRINKADQPVVAPFMGPDESGNYIENPLIGTLHDGGGKYTTFEITDKIQKRQITPGADQRFLWMQSVINCTHYIYGEGEKDYLRFSDFPEVKFIQREKIDNPNYAWIPNY
jgi:hypothetical protein